MLARQRQQQDEARRKAALEKEREAERRRQAREDAKRAADEEADAARAAVRETQLREASLYNSNSGATVSLHNGNNFQPSFDEVPFYPATSRGGVGFESTTVPGGAKPPASPALYDQQHLSPSPPANGHGGAANVERTVAVVTPSTPQNQQHLPPPAGGVAHNRQLLPWELSPTSMPNPSSVPWLPSQIEAANPFPRSSSVVEAHDDTTINGGGSRGPSAPRDNHHYPTIGSASALPGLDSQTNNNKGPLSVETLLNQVSSLQDQFSSRVKHQLEPCLNARKDMGGAARKKKKEQGAPVIDGERVGGVSAASLQMAGRLIGLGGLGGDFNPSSTAGGKSTLAVPVDAHSKFATFKTVPPIISASVEQVTRDVGHQVLLTTAFSSQPKPALPSIGSYSANSTTPDTTPPAVLLLEALDALLPTMVHDVNFTPLVVEPALKAVDALLEIQDNNSTGSSGCSSEHQHFNASLSVADANELQELRLALDGLQASRSSDPRVLGETSRVLQCILQVYEREATRIGRLTSLKALRPDLTKALGDLNKSILVTGTTYAAATKDLELLNERLTMEKTLRNAELSKRAAAIHDPTTIYGKIEANNTALKENVDIIVNAMSNVESLLKTRKALEAEEEGLVEALQNADETHFANLDALEETVASTRHIQSVTAASSNLLTKVSSLLSKCDNILTTRTSATALVEVGSSRARLSSLLADAEAVYTKLHNINEILQVSSPVDHHQEAHQYPSSTTVYGTPAARHFFTEHQAALFEAKQRLDAIRKQCGGSSGRSAE